MIWPSFDYPIRMESVRSTMESLELDGLVISRMVNIRYLTGFTGSAALLYLGADGATVLATDGRYTTQAAEELAIDAVVRIRGVEGYRPVLEDCVAPGRIGLEADTTTWSDVRHYNEWLPEAKLVPTTDVVEGARKVKDKGEMVRIERAVEIADETLAAVMGHIRPGVSEVSVAARIEAEFRARGASGPSFDTIAATGPRSAMPHAHPTSAPVEAGHLLVLDFGCVVEGYCSDMTRTLVVGAPTARQREVYELVSAAQEAARAMAAPGVCVGDLDRAARAVIESGGHGEAFSHPLGHGVGLEIHEAPWVRGTTTDTLEPGYVVTDEPGVYLPGFGGVRIEDMIVVTASGCRTLTRSPKDLASMTV